MTANKALGQHWLFNPQALNDVADAAGVTAGDTVLEIGPGLGTLTEVLLERGARVIAVDVDESVISGLQSTLESDDLTLIHQDILRFDLTTLPDGYKVAANIPYYITSPIIQLLMGGPSRPSKAALLVQKEVARRLAAKPGQLSVLAVSVQLRARVELGAVVPRHLFKPVPKVDSQIVKLTPLQRPKIPPNIEKAYLKLVKLAFASKRKTLVNSLSGALQIDKSEVVSAVEKNGLEKNIRPQALSLDDWKKLYNEFEPLL